MKSARSLEVTKCRDLRKFYNLREPKEGEVITYDRWYYLTYGIIDGLNYESKLAESIHNRRYGGAAEGTFDAKRRSIWREALTKSSEA